jgi:mRNA interferase HigB
VNVISRRGLLQQAKAAKADSATLKALLSWFRETRKARWTCFEDVRAQFASADRVGGVLIFNILGGRFRLIAAFNFRRQNLHVKALLTHKDYDKKEWMKWS